MSSEVDQGSILIRAIKYSDVLMQEGGKNIVEEFSKALYKI